jgi:basic amino acid/polyamine antiporter, APA family
MAGLFATKPTERLVAESEQSDGTLRRAVGTLDLTAFGLGAIIGTGIFVIIGKAIGDSGPAIVLSFVLAGLTCVFSALSYAELASTIPLSGSAYSYSYATLGELVAWIIGWDLLLEYGVSVAAIAVGWGQYFNELLHSAFGTSLPQAIAAPPGEGGVVNVPAVFVVLAVVGLLVAGVRQSARTNTAMVGIKLVVLGIFIVVGLTSFDDANLHPFAPHGFNGVVDAAALIFFAYIGFDAVSTAGEEVEKPQRSLPIAIVGSLAIATLIYIAVSLVATGLVPASELAGSDAPLATALEKGAGVAWAPAVISLGALVAITSVVLTISYGQSRVAFAMSRDGLLPRWLSRVGARQTPWRITLTFGVLIAALAAFVPLTTIAELINIGTLFAFVLVNIGVVVLRRTQPDLERPFRVPFVPLFPLIGCGLCIFLMTKLSADTWWRFAIWLAAGLAIYFAYGRRNSRLRTEETVAP